MKINQNKNVLIIAPHPHKNGGVSNYYTTLSQYLPSHFKFLFRGTKSNNPNIFHYLFDYFITTIKLIFLLSTRNFKYILINNSLSKFSLFRDLVYIIIIALFRVKFILFFRGWNQDYGDNMNKFDKYIFSKFYLKAYKVIVLSSSFKNQLLNLGYDKEIFLETTTVDENLLHYFTLDLKHQLKNEVNLLFLSRVLMDKGIYELLDAYNELKIKFNNINLTICGDGSDLKDVIKYSIEKNIKDISFTGYIRGDEKIAIYKKSHIFILPSYTEGMPNSLLEAMAFGLPIITTYVGGIRDFFEDGRMGYFIKEKSADDIIMKIEELIIQPELRRNMSNFNFNYAKDKFYSSRVAQRFIKICQD